jgi:hypothetical protein
LGRPRSQGLCRIFRPKVCNNVTISSILGGLQIHACSDRLK